MNPRMTIIVALLALTISSHASEEEYARNREIRILPETYTITAEYPKPHGRTTVTISTIQTNGMRRIESIIFRSESVTLAFPKSLIADLDHPQPEQTALTYSSGMRTGEGLYASVTMPWGLAVTNATHKYNERTFCIVDGRLSLFIDKHPKGNWYDTE